MRALLRQSALTTLTSKASMFSRSYRLRPFGWLIEIDLYTPRGALDKRGMDLHADTVLVLRRQHRDWRWVVGVRVMGFGLAVSAPK